MYFLLVIVICWSILVFTDIIFKTCMFFPYLTLLNSSGVTIGFGVLVLSITRFNSTFRKLGHLKPNLLRKFYDFGAVITVLSLLPSVALLIISWFHDFEEQGDYSGPYLTPVLPGFNLPYSHLPYYITALFICTLIHEFGHALAASRERILIECCGFKIYLVLPMTYIAVDNEQLLQLSYWQQIRIYSAGIWHNIVLSIFAILLLVSNTILLAPVFQKGNGLTVLHVEQHSSVSQPAGFSKGDQILSINNCILYDTESWTQCLQRLKYSPQQGFCASDDFILQENSALEGSRSLKCCGSDSRRLCFQYLSTKKDATVCLPARKLVERSSGCNRDLMCENHFSCLVPVLSNASERFVEIKRRNKYSVLYIGSLEELALDVTVSSWTANFRFFSVTFVEIYETLLMYILAFSSGLAIINAVPCYGLDGEHIFESLVHLTLSKHIHRGSDRILIVKCIKIFGVILLFVTIIHTILSLSSNFHFSFL